MNDIQACSPTSLNFLAEESLKDLAEYYKTKLVHELVIVAKSYLAHHIKVMYLLLDSLMLKTLEAILQYHRLQY